jgi:formamidopyrimidine-DNA glycosylase
MPELPDVETYKRYIDATALHKTVKKVAIDASDLLEGISKTSLQRHLRDRQLVSTRRHGKYLFVQLSDERWLVFHFGMTGRLKYFRDLDDTPPYTDMLIEFDNGFHLAYIAPRKLGMIGLINDTDRFVRQRQLGPDAMDVTLQQFEESARGRRSAVKTWLMNQRVIAGIGNVYSDEILFHAGIHPKANIKDLQEPQIKRLFEALREVIHTAVNAQADPKKMPSTYLTPRRGNAKQCPRCGGLLDQVTIGGRTAYFCPKCQSG